MHRAGRRSAFPYWQRAESIASSARQFVIGDLLPRKSDVSLTSSRRPLLARFYYRYIDDGNVADFIHAVSRIYTLATLHRLSSSGQRCDRRGAVLALGLLGKAESIAFLADALHDEDRGVRLIAEDALPALWSRTGTAEDYRALQTVRRYRAARQNEDAARLAAEVLDQAPQFAEAWYQRSEALTSMGFHYEAIADSQRALDCEPYHFPAALLMARNYTELSDFTTAVSCVQWALQIHPHYEFARAQLRRLERRLREQTDR
jgi:tetratricopeptide (TPR) repeat protein